MGEWSVCGSEETLEGKHTGGGRKKTHRKRRPKKREREKEIRRRHQPADGSSAGEINRRKRYRLGKKGKKRRENQGSVKRPI